MELHEHTTSAVTRLTEKLDAAIVEGLKRHGYEFNTRAELANFIKEKCQAISKGDHPNKTTVYYAEGTAFFYHKEKVDFKTEGLNATVSLGSYAFIPKDLKRWQKRNAARNAKK